MAEVSATLATNVGTRHSLFNTMVISTSINDSLFNMTEVPTTWAPSTNGSLYNITKYDDVSHTLSVHYMMHVVLITVTCVANILVMLVIIKNK